MLFGFNICHAGLCLPTVFCWRCFEFGDEGWGSVKEGPSWAEDVPQRGQTRRREAARRPWGSKAMFLSGVLEVLCLYELCIEFDSSAPWINSCLSVFEWNERRINYCLLVVPTWLSELKTCLDLIVISRRPVAVTWRGVGEVCGLWNLFRFRFNGNDYHK